MRHREHQRSQTTAREAHRPAARGRPPSISFVIVNKDDRAVSDTLDALRRVSSAWPARTETIVVDASDGRLDDVRDRFSEVRWVAFPGRADRPTIAAQRNVGVASSRGEVVVFIDASCVPYPDWLPALIDPVVQDGEVIVAGSYRSAGKPSIHDEDMHFVGTDRHIDQAPTLNLAVVRRVFESIGGFDESFHYGSDLDFTWRAVEHGFRIRYAPEAAVAHQWGSWHADLRRSFRYGQACYRLYAKHPHRLGKAWREDPVSVIYPVLLLIAPLVLIVPRMALLILIPLAKNVRHRPLLTVTHHFAYAAGILAAACADLPGTRRR